MAEIMAATLVGAAPYSERECTMKKQAMGDPYETHVRNLNEKGGQCMIRGQHQPLVHECSLAQRSQLWRRTHMSVGAGGKVAALISGPGRYSHETHGKPFSCVGRSSNGGS
eukprot:COSAG01_NODE_279_length_19520_cov_41.772154_9_plen_111_part_00